MGSSTALHTRRYKGFRTRLRRAAHEKAARLVRLFCWAQFAVWRQQAAIDTSNRFASEGTPVRYIRTTFVPSESRSMCLFEGPDSASVEEVNKAANIPFTRVIEALDLTP